MRDVRFESGPEFSKVVSGEKEILYPHLMLELAQDAYPELSVQEVRENLEQLSRRAHQFLESTSATPTEGLSEEESHAAIRSRLQGISDFLYQVEGFHGNLEDYYDPRNSYLHEVLQRKTGIPISMALLYQTVAEGVGILLKGINSPAHFMLGCFAAEPLILIDPFTGQLLTEEEAREQLIHLTGQPIALADYTFTSASPWQITTRMLRNLKAAYLARHEWSQALPVQQRLITLSPDEYREYRDLGLIWVHLYQGPPALEAFKTFQEEATAAEKEEIEPFLLAANKLIAELN
ncbi:Transglutaminase [Planctomycetales bacterium 10988]|nr:Transglutaminase [Planctomycetales bacterium 10988]